MMGHATPFAHQYGANARQWGLQRRLNPRRVLLKHTVQQMIDFPRDGFGKTAMLALLPPIGDPEDRNISAKGGWGVEAELPLPEDPQLDAGQLCEVVDLERHVAPR